MAGEGRGPRGAELLRGRGVPGEGARRGGEVMAVMKDGVAWAEV